MQDLLTGYAITAIALTAVDGISSIIHSLCEYATYSINLKTAQKQVEINQLAEEQENESSCVRAIGFAADEPEGEEEYDDDDGCDP